MFSCFSWFPSDIVPLSATCWGYSLIIIIVVIIILLLYNNHFTQPWSQHASCHEISESWSVKLKDTKERNFPLYALKLWAWPQIDFHLSGVSYSCGISSKSRVHPPSDDPRFRPHKTPRYTPIMYHSPCLPDIQISFLQAALHNINQPFPWSTHWAITSTLPGSLAIFSFSITSTFPNHQRTLSSILSSTPFFTLHNFLIRAFWI